MRYDVRRGFFVQGLFEVEIRGLHDIMAVVDEGNGNRKVSSHLLNKDSSRSHSLLTVYLDSVRKDPEDGHLVKQFGKVWRCMPQPRATLRHKNVKTRNHHNQSSPVRRITVY